MKPEEKALGYIAENNLLEKGDTVIAGVSGGADSMCMLSILLKMREPFELKLSVVHVNHGIRGESADRDEIFVKDFCEKNGVEFCAYHADIPKMAADERLTEEEAGRKYRYAVFEKAAEEKKAGKIAVAHNRDDNAAVLMPLYKDGRCVHLHYPAPTFNWEVRRVVLPDDAADITAFRVGANPRGRKLTYWLRNVRLLR